MRVPLLIAGPNVKPRVEDRLALNLDLAPTLLELAGVTAPAGASGFHGTSLLTIVRDTAPTWRDGFVYECLYGYGGTHPMLAAITPRWTLIRTWENRHDVGRSERSFVELYDREADPAEATNVIARPEAASLVTQLSRLIDTHVAALPRLRDGSFFCTTWGISEVSLRSFFRAAAVRAQSPDRPRSSLSVRSRSPVGRSIREARRRI